MVTSDITSLVELNPSNETVTAYGFMYNSSLPLRLVPPSQSALVIQEFICIRNILNYTKDLKMQFRWMQRFGRDFDEYGSKKGKRGKSSKMGKSGKSSKMGKTGGSSNMDTTRSNSSTSGTNKRRKRMMTMMKKYAGWILDDINIRIWNGSHFLQVLSDDFNGYDRNNLNFESYNLRLAELEKDGHCKSSGNDYYLQFDLEDIGTTTRYLIVNVTNISLAYEERGEFFSFCCLCIVEVALQGVSVVYGIPY